MKALRYGLASTTLAILLCASFVAGARYGTLVVDWLGLPWLIESHIVATTTEPPEVAPTFSLFWQAWNVVTHNYVDKGALDVQKMTYGAIQGMVNSLGDAGHSRFLTPSTFRREQESLRGSFIGIGAEVGLRNGQPAIIAPLPGSPAERAGLLAGDAILRVDGEEVGRLSLTELMSRLRGDAGTSVTLTVVHLGSDVPVDITVTRQRVTVRPVSYALVPDSHVADVRLSEFSRGATSQLRQALTDAMNDHASAVVLDLRDNPGGILDQAVEVASQFLSDGVVVVVRDAEGHERDIAAKPGGVATSLPVAVLINNGTASAAEIVAGALDRNHRATLVGQPTFGTSTVLSTFRLNDGSAILLGTSHWLPPDRQPLTGKGVQPDLPVRVASQSDVLTPTRLQQLTAAQVQHSGDNQLLSAVRYLEEHPEPRTGG